MERLQQLQRDGTTMNAVRSERNNNNSLDDNVSAVRNGKLELMVIDIVERTILPIIEPLIRRTVKEEIDVALEKVLPSMNLNSANEASTSQSRSLQLQFLNKISLPVWTGRKIEGEGNTPIEVALVDTSTGKIVSSGPEAEAKVEIVVLEGDCGDEEFNSKIVREWEGKKSILRGNNYLKLKEGIGFVNEITFAHNSEWMKNHKFRLGGTVRDAIFGTIIKGAKTEPFTVKDWRNTLKGKNYPPLASDEVWRLEKIHKHGAYHDRLRTAKINTVKDFLTLFSINPERLQKILRVGTDAKVWKVMVDHAQTCIVDEGVYLYHDPSYEQKTGVVFNAAGDLLGLVIESQYFQVNGLPEGKKLDGQKSMISATEHWEEVISLNNDASLIQSATVVISVQSPSQVDLRDSNRRTRPPTNDHAQPMSSSQSPRQSLNDSNCRTPPSNDRAQPTHSPRQSLSYSNYTIPAPTNDHSQPRSSCQSPRQSLNDSNCMTPPPVNDHAQISQSPRQSLSNSNWTPPPTTDHAHPRSSSQQSLSDSNGRTPPPSSDHSQPSQSPRRALSYSNCRTPPPTNDHAQPRSSSKSPRQSLSDSNCRTPPPTNDHAQPRSSSKSPRQSLSDSNCRTPPLSNDHAEPSGSSQLFTQKTLRDFNSRTLPLNNDHAQLSGSSQVIGGGTNSLFICEPNCEDNLARLSGTWPSPDWVFEKEFLQSYLNDYNLQSQIPNIEMHYEQPCSAGSMLVVSSQSLLIDRTQKFWPQMAKLLRRASIRRRIDAIESEGVHIQKRQRLY